MKKKTIAIMTLTLALLLAGCGGNEQKNEPQEPNTITEMSEPRVTLHEEIVEQEFGEDEEVDNPYYKRTVTDDGEPAYAVIRQRDGQMVNLPMDNTEQVTISYKENGEDVTMEQYDLYVQSTTEEEPVSPEEHPDITETSEEAADDSEEPESDISEAEE